MADIKDSKKLGIRNKEKISDRNRQTLPTDQELFQFMRPSHTYSATHGMADRLAFAIPVMLADRQTQQKCI